MTSARNHAMLPALCVLALLGGAACDSDDGPTPRVTFGM